MAKKDEIIKEYTDIKRCSEDIICDNTPCLSCDGCKDRNESFKLIYSKDGKIIRIEYFLKMNETIISRFIDLKEE